MTPTDQDILLIESFQNDWNKFARDVLGVRLDREQRKILRDIQENYRVSVRSGNSRGKDFIAAVASLCFLYLHCPSKVISTAPTGRQVHSIMMPEIANVYNNALIPLGGEVLNTKIKFDDNPQWYLEGFKAADKNKEAWQGYHSPNIMVVVTEASGVPDESFDAMEGLLTAENHKLLLIFNPIRTTGTAFNSTRSPLYVKHKLSSLNTVNVRAKTEMLPGQVGYNWVKQRVQIWCRPVNEEAASLAELDFKFDGKWYRPNDLFRVKVLGEFPKEAEGQLIPLHWIDLAVDRWREWERSGVTDKFPDPLALGVDVAGWGTDNTMFCYRYGDIVTKFETIDTLGGKDTVHMEVAGKVKNRLKGGGSAFIDTIGEGAGVYSRLKELRQSVYSVKHSESGKDKKDITGELEFLNVRAWLHWCLRDALNPEHDAKLALPSDDELIQELTAPTFEVMSNGNIKIESKKNIKDRIGRSPDKLDSLLATFYKGKRSFKAAKFKLAKPR